MIIKTTIHHYNFNTDEPEEKKAYNRLCKKLKKNGLKCFASIGSRDSDYYRNEIKPLDNTLISLDLSHIFNNQWNTFPTVTSKTGLRVFDWAEAIWPNKRIKTGQWLEQTKQMKFIRDTTFVCNYCGKYSHTGGMCLKCVNGPHLSKDQLHLLRLVPVSNKDSRGIPELTEPEKAFIMPLFLKGQTVIREKADKKKRAEVHKEYIAKLLTAETECKGFIWLLDAGINTENCIFYEHSNTFSFGWQSVLDMEVASILSDKLDMFPFTYEIKTNERTWKREV